MIRVALAFALPRRQQVIELQMREGATLADALAAARLDPRFIDLDWGRLQAGIWSRAASVATVLRDGDRVELYRELKADPKDARRRRVRNLKPSPRSRSGP